MTARAQLFATGRYLDRIDVSASAVPLHRAHRRARQPEDRYAARHSALRRDSRERWGCVSECLLPTTSCSAIDGGVATVTLNRPQALNAFTLGMYRRFDPVLRAWAEGPGGPCGVDPRRRGARLLRRRRCSRDRRGRARHFRRPGADQPVLPRGIRADPPYPPLSETLSRDHRRDHDGRRRRGVGQRRLPRRHRAHDAGDAGDRDRPLPRCRRDPVPQPRARAYRPLSRADRRAARRGRRALLRLCHAFRAARACRRSWSRRSAISAWREGEEGAQIEAALAAFATDPGEPPLASRRAAIDRCICRRHGRGGARRARARSRSGRQRRRMGGARPAPGSSPNRRPASRSRCAS